MTTELDTTIDTLTVDASVKEATADKYLDGSMTTRCIQETMRVYRLATLISQDGATDKRVSEFIRAVQTVTWTLGLVIPTSTDEAGQDYGPGRTWLAQTATVNPDGDLRAGVAKLHALTTLAVHSWWIIPASDLTHARQMIVGSTAAILGTGMPRTVRSPYDVTNIVSTLDSATLMVDVAYLGTEKTSA